MLTGLGGDWDQLAAVGGNDWGGVADDLDGVYVPDPTAVKLAVGVWYPEKVFITF